MSTFRKVVLPVLRVLIWAIIAIALVRLAFGPAGEEAAAPPQDPTFNVTEPQVPVTVGTVRNLVTIDGQIVADPAVDVKITLAGTVSQVYATQGQWVDIGTPIIEVTQSIDQEPLINQTTGQVTNRPPKITKAQITATSAGTLTSFSLLKDQIVSVGETAAQVSPGTLSVTGTLTPEQQFRLLTMPTEAMINVSGGPAPFPCVNLRLESSTGGTPDPNNPMGPGGGGAGGNTLTCSIPPGPQVFAGLAAKMEVTSGESVDVLVIPVTAVQGRVQTGNVWLVGPDGTTTTETQVGLGLTDGEMIEITSGLTEGQMVLQFVPVGDQTVPTDEFGNPIIEQGAVDEFGNPIPAGDGAVATIAPEPVEG